MARANFETVVSADDTQFQATMRRVKAAGDKTYKHLKKQFIGLGAAITAAMGLERVIEGFDRIGKIATRLDVSTQVIQRLGHAAEKSGASLTKLQTILTRLERRTGEAIQNPEGTQAKRFRELGIYNFEAFAGASFESKLTQIGKGFGAAGVTGNASLLGLLDVESRELIPFFKALAEGSLDLKEAATLTDEEVRAVERFNDAMTDLKNNFAVAGGKLVAILAGTRERDAVGRKTGAWAKIKQFATGGWSDFGDPIQAEQDAWMAQNDKVQAAAFQKSRRRIDTVLGAHNIAMRVGAMGLMPGGGAIDIGRVAPTDRGMMNPMVGRHMDIMRQLTTAPIMAAQLGLAMTMGGGAGGLGGLRNLTRVRGGEPTLFPEDPVASFTRASGSNAPAFIGGNAANSGSVISTLQKQVDLLNKILGANLEVRDLMEDTL